MGSQKDFFNSVAFKWDSMCVHDHDKINKILDMTDIYEGSAVLDVGCGTGVLVPFLLEKKISCLTCIDISENMIEVARQKYRFDNVEFIVSDIMEFEPERKYDVIMLYSCFPHFDDKASLLSRLSSFLNKGGRLCICHSESRDAINNMHSAKAEVSQDNLPEACVTSQMMEKYGLKTLICIDDEEMYVVLGELK